MRAKGDALTLRLRQEAMRAEKLLRPCAGRFVAMEERAMARAAAKEAGVQVSFDGGWEACERAQACFHLFEDMPVYTYQWLQIRWNARFARVAHGDLLGSLMALGIDRSYFGDLVTQEGEAFLCALPEPACRLPGEWQKAGNTPIQVSVMEDAPKLAVPVGVFLRDTVPSLRLDCVLASGMKLSRAKASEMIRQGLVMVNHMPEERVDRQLEAGSIVSIRHFGRLCLRQVDAPTRKDRLPIVLEIFSKG